MELIIEVTQANIDKAKEQQAYNRAVYAATGNYSGVDKDKVACMCPVQWALKDLGFESPHAGYGIMHGIKDGKLVSFDTPNHVKRFMQYYDMGYDVYPFQFRVETSR